MPLYEYECKKCGNSFEAFRPMAKFKTAKCPECKAMADKIFTPVPIIFKGSGFYCTDNKKSGALATTAPATKSAADSKSDSASGSDSKPETKTETKPAAKTDSNKSESGAKKAAVA